MILPDPITHRPRLCLPPPPPVVATPALPADAVHLARLAALALRTFDETRIAARREIADAWGKTSARQILPHDRRAAVAALLLLAAALDRGPATLAARQAAGVGHHCDEADRYAEGWERWATLADGDRATEPGPPMVAGGGIGMSKFAWALSLWQPWAHAVAHLGKRIENRDRWHEGTPALAVARRLVGSTILIHAAKGVGKRAEYESAVYSIETMRDMPLLSYVPALASLPRMALVATATLADVVETTYGCHRRAYRHNRGTTVCDLCRGPAVGACPKADPWATPGIGLVLADVVPFATPIPLKGAQGFFKVPTEAGLRAARLHVPGDTEPPRDTLPGAGSPWDGCGARVPGGSYAGCVCTLKGKHARHEAWSTPESTGQLEMLEAWTDDRGLAEAVTAHDGEGLTVGSASR